MNELEQYSSQLINKIKNNNLSSKLYVKIWKGKDDVLDNISGVSIVNDTGHVISHIQLVQLECEENYLKLAVSIGEKVAKILEEKNHHVEVINKIS